MAEPENGSTHAPELKVITFSREHCILGSLDGNVGQNYFFAEARMCVGLEQIYPNKD